MRIFLEVKEKHFEILIYAIKDKHKDLDLFDHDINFFDKDEEGYKFYISHITMFEKQYKELLEEDDLGCIFIKGDKASDLLMLLNESYQIYEEEQFLDFFYSLISCEYYRKKEERCDEDCYCRRPKNNI